MRLRNGPGWVIFFSLAVGACVDDGEDPATGDDGGTSGGSGSADDGSGSGGDGAETGGSQSAIPCDVQTVLADNCGMCHDDPPKFGAPMALKTLADFELPAKSDPARPVHEMIPARIADDVAPMPPNGMPAADEQVLLDWISAGRPEGSGEQCEGGGDDGGGIGPEYLPCAEPDYVFTAHGSDPDEGFHIPQAGAENLYQCFTFKSPASVPTQATAWAPIVDDDRVLHHWILYRTPTPQEDGGSGPCDMPGDTLFVAGWAPGGLNYEMPPDVGLEFAGPDDYFILQIHYHNTAGYSDAIDKSGVALCTTEEPRPQTAGIYTLGTLGINIPAGATDHEEQNTCPSWMTAALPEPVHLLTSFPHMHELGRGFRTEILRGGADDASEMLVNVDPFNFESQIFYEHAEGTVINPGDAIRTTCTFDNPYDFNVTFGEATEDEMCFNFVMAYPVELLGANRRCVGLF